MVEIILNRDTDATSPSAIPGAHLSKLPMTPGSLQPATRCVRRCILPRYPAAHSSTSDAAAGCFPCRMTVWVRRSARFALTRIRSQATVGLRRRFAVDSDWLIEQGSVLDNRFVSSLGTPWMRPRDWSHRSFNTHCRGG
jgi:hypothetical protein